MRAALAQYAAGGARNVRGYWGLAAYVGAHLKALRIAPVHLVFLRQIYFTGIEALRIVTALALLAGILVVTQATALVGENDELEVKVLVWTLFRELGPLLAAVIIIARSSAAIASELALMKVGDELLHLERMGIPPRDYLAVPRVVGVTLSVLAVAVYFQLIAVLGGLAVSALFQNVSFAEQLDHFLRAVRFADIGFALLKSLLYGLAIAVVSCYHGFEVEKSPTEVPKAAIKAVIQSLLFVFLLDAGFAYLEAVL